MWMMLSMISMAGHRHLDTTLRLARLLAAITHFSHCRIMGGVVVAMHLGQSQSIM
jgi:hypothetical protein